MAVRLYDEALVQKIGKWVKNSKLTILKPEESTRFFEMTLDDIKDKTLQLPLIAISRDKNIDILSTQKQSKTFNGFSNLNATLGDMDYLNAVAENEKFELEKDLPAPTPINVNVVPIRIGYQIDIYTRGMAEADEYIRNFVFNFINYPKLEIILPYNNVDLHHESTIFLDASISDNSDIKEHLFADQFVRFSLKLIIDDAYLFSIPTVERVSIEPYDIRLVDNMTKEIVASEAFNEALIDVNDPEYQKH